MMKFKTYALIGFFMAPLLIAACNGGQKSASELSSVTEQGMAQKKPSEDALTVYKSPTCGCCEEWINHIEREKFTTTVQDSADVAAIKDQYGVGTSYRSCHTAVSSSGYIFEGHVPAKYIQQFLADTPDNAIGLAVPGMPVGSPGMEIENKFEPYEVMLLKKDGTAEIYATVSNQEQQYQ